ncbi:hypothetical protein JOF53_000004 [Crossiella equi]|uniref:Flp pilus assembly protein, ATPase CpaE n=1 Tax=Crossiella equi TaxID=130796 RepID=A0ABS5A4D1_9PSEU|nr:hypothetical protein [Crossiella equi]MBP2471132.1 hypothetical protein [Crossiella equi]
MAEDTAQLRMMTEGAEPVIKGGRPLVFVITDTSGPAADVRAWLELMGGQPSVVAVLVDTGQAGDLADIADRAVVHRWEAAGPEPARLFDLIASVALTSTETAAGSSRRVDEPHIVVITAGRGGAGCTTVALSLAACLAARSTTSAKVCLLDLDMAGGVLGAVSATSPRSASSFLLEPDFDLDTVHRHAVALTDWRLDLFTGVSTPPEARLVEPAAAVRALDTLSGYYDVVVVDLGRLRWDLDGVEHAVLEFTSQVLYLADRTRTTESGLESELAALCGTSGHAFPSQYAGLVWTRAEPQAAAGSRTSLPGHGLTVLQHLPDIGADREHTPTAGPSPEVLRTNARWAAGITLLLEAVVGPGCVTVLNDDVAELLPSLHRDGTRRREIRVRRRFLPYRRTSPTPPQEVP